MKTLTKDRLVALDAKCGEAFVGLIKLRPRLQTILSDENVGHLYIMAHRLHIPVEELCSYVWLQTYILVKSQTLDNVPEPHVVARQFEIDIRDFKQYIEARALVIGGILQEVDEDPQDLSQEEWVDYLDDLKEQSGETGE